MTATSLRLYASLTDAPTLVSAKSASTFPVTLNSGPTSRILFSFSAKYCDGHRREARDRLLTPGN